MQRATDITIAAYRWTCAADRGGHDRRATSARLMNAATRSWAANRSSSLILLGEAAAYPHGSRQAADGA